MQQRARPRALTWVCSGSWEPAQLEQHCSAASPLVVACLAGPSHPARGSSSSYLPRASPLTPPLPCAAPRQMPATQSLGEPSLRRSSSEFPSSAKRGGTAEEVHALWRRAGRKVVAAQAAVEGMSRSVRCGGRAAAAAACCCCGCCRYCCGCCCPLLPLQLQCSSLCSVGARAGESGGDKNVMCGAILHDCRSPQLLQCTSSPSLLLSLPPYSHQVHIPGAVQGIDLRRKHDETNLCE